MAKLLALLVIISVCYVTNAQLQAPNQKPIIGLTFDEIVVSSDLNVRRKSKENRQGKKLLTNVPSGTTGPGSPTATASKLVSSTGSWVIPEKRERRGTGEQERQVSATNYWKTEW
ncbi:uncharacterized protein LOC105695442 [Orussus abietinus]|uniref:uncharacterized protein LOC105695442 n=1 Tax=Orussus abietinus TaxID=222816 RepID=UPI0006263177|nr:uncharacterized protein LOC105695442 [Orussus abietinus]